MIRAAVIGLGIIGKLHAELTLLNGNLVAVCDVDESCLNLYPGVKQYKNYVRMLDEVKPDVVHICTPHYLHAEMVLASLKRNVNVLCEKPLCINSDELDEILRAEKNSEAQLGVCLQNRYLTVNRFVKEFLRENPPISAIGYMAWCRGETYYNSSPWRGNKSMEGGGVLINQALHTLDLLQWFCGDVSSVCATASNLTLQKVIDVEDTAFLVCDGNVPFTLFATNGSKTDFPVEITLMTEKGLLKVTPNQVSFNGEIVYTEDVSKYYIKPCYGYGHDFLVADFYRCIENGEKFSVAGEEGAKVVKIIFAAYESNGRTVKL